MAQTGPGLAFQIMDSKGHSEHPLAAVIIRESGLAQFILNMLDG